MTLALLNLTAPKAGDSDYGKKMFGRCLVGIGFALLIDALINVVAVAGFANAGAVPFLFRPGDTNLVAISYSTNATNGTNSQKQPRIIATNQTSTAASINPSNAVSTRTPNNFALSLEEAGSESSYCVKLSFTQKNGSSMLKPARRACRMKAIRSAFGKDSFLEITSRGRMSRSP